MSVTDGFLCESYNDLTLAHCDAAGSRHPNSFGWEADISVWRGMGSSRQKLLACSALEAQNQ